MTPEQTQLSARRDATHSSPGHGALSRAEVLETQVCALCLAPGDLASGVPPAGPCGCQHEWESLFQTTGI